MPDLEPYALYFMAAGAAVFLIGLFWVLIVAFRTGFLKKAFTPVLVILLGVLVALFVPASNIIRGKTPQQTTAATEQKKDTQGNVEERLTLTGAKREEYAKLTGGTKYAVVQWANEDVTDEDAAVLGEQTELRELKLNDSLVTDRTLERLVKLPKLTKLYIARTRVTPDGVQKHILNNPECKLMEIDVSDLNVPGKALRDWKNADKTRQVNQ